VILYVFHNLPFSNILRRSALYDLMNKVNREPLVFYSCRFTGSFSVSLYYFCANAPILKDHKYGGFMICLTKMIFFLTFGIKINEYLACKLAG